MTETAPWAFAEPTRAGLCRDCQRGNLLCTVDILGKKYEAGYEPVKNAAGETIGVYYVGFLLE